MADRVGVGGVPVGWQAGTGGWRPPDGEAWISVDVETSGPAPAVGSLIAIGACLVSDPSVGFSVELRPLPDRPWSTAAEDIHGLSRERLALTGLEPGDAMRAFEAWVGSVARSASGAASARVAGAAPGSSSGAVSGSGTAQPVFVAFNAPFDWLFVAEYAWRYLGRNPFGHTALDIKALYLGRHLADVGGWADTSRVAVLERYPVDLPHTHNALDDAREQATILRRLLEEAGP